MFARHCSHLRGDFAECGVWRGGTALLLAEVIDEERPSATLHLFDTFRGMPKAAEEDPSGHRQGDFDTSLEHVEALLGSLPNVALHPGRIPGTFDFLGDVEFAFVHVDVDLFASTWDCLTYFYPRLVPGAVLVCDDYGFPLYEQSARLAIDTFLADKSESAISLRSGQCVIIKHPMERAEERLTLRST